MSLVTAASAFDANVAWDGWVGTFFGAIAGALIAVLVLVLTLRHEREAFRGQLAADRALAREQWEHDRDLAIEERRLEAFAELAGALLSFGELDESAEATEGKFRVVLTAYHRWALYVPKKHHAFSDGVNRGLATAREQAAKSWDLGVGHPEYAQRQFGVRDGIGAIDWIVSRGRTWHQDPGARRRIEAEAEEQFERRITIDLTTDEDREV